MLANVLISAQAAAAATRGALVGVLIGWVWLVAIALAGTAGWVWLRDRSRNPSPPNPWAAPAAWTLTTGFMTTITVLLIGAAT
jgi:hypothetical protein